MSFKAQSEVLGVILLLSISITAIAAILLFGQPIISGAEGDAQFDRMENEFSLLDASMSSSVLGASESQSVSLNVQSGRLESNPEASWMNVTYEDAGGSKSTLANITMGNLRYVQDGKTLAYEGGGIFRSNEGENFTSVISSPEFSYRGATLTLPSYNIQSSGVVSGDRNSIKVESTGDPNLVFPDQDLDNPLDEGNATITIKSEYYKGWESFFRSRTTGAIQKVNDEEQKIVFSLEVPTELLLNKGIQFFPGGDPEAKGGSTLPTTEKIQVDLPSADSIIQPELDKCFGPSPQSNCVDIEDDPSVSLTSLDEDKIYYADGDYSMNSLHEAPNGNVTILVENNLRYKKNFNNYGNSEPAVEVYAGNHLDLDGGNINTGSNTGNSSKFITYIGGEIQGDVSGWSSPGTGGISYTGVIYAPNTDMGGCPGGPTGGSNRKITGGATIKGTLVGDNICLQGGSVGFTGDEINLDLSPDVSLVRYLHITENNVTISG